MKIILKSFVHSIKNSIKLLIKINEREEIDKVKLQRLCQQWEQESWIYLFILLLKNITWKNPIDQFSKTNLNLLECFIHVLFNKKIENFHYIIVKSFVESNVIIYLKQIVKYLTLTLPVQISIIIGISQSRLIDDKLEMQKYIINWIYNCVRELSLLPRQYISSGLCYRLLYFFHIKGFWYSHTVKLTSIFNPFTLNIYNGLFLPLLNKNLLKFPNLNDINMVTRSESNSIFIDMVDQKRNVAQVLKECGYICTHNEEYFSLFLLSFSLPLVNIENFLAEIIGNFLITYTKIKILNQKPFFFNTLEEKNLKIVNWNEKVFMEVITKNFPKICWNRVWNFLDYPDFIIPDQIGFQVLQQIRKSIGMFPDISDLAFCLWENKRGQLSLIINSIHLPEVFQKSLRKIKKKSFFEKNNSDCGSWYSLDLIETLIELSTSFYTDILQLFRIPCKKCPEILVSALFYINNDSVLKIELLEFLFPRIISKLSKKKYLCAFRLWNINSEEFVKLCCRLKHNDLNVFNQIFIIIKFIGINVLLKFFDYTLSWQTQESYDFIFQLAGEASQREFIDFKQWIIKQLYSEQKNKLFIKSAINFINENKLETSHISFNWQFILIESLYRLMPNLNCINQIKLREIYNRYINETSNDKDIKPLLYKQNNTLILKRIFQYDEIVTEILKNVFKQKVTLIGLIHLIKTWNDQNLIGIFVFNIIDEFRFFPNYPEDQILIAAELYGLFISHKIFKKHALCVTLYLTLKSLGNGTKMLKFGLKVLETCREVLQNWPSYCEQLLKKKIIQHKAPQFINFLKKRLKQEKIKNSNVFIEKQTCLIKEHPVVTKKKSFKVTPKISLQFNLDTFKVEKIKYKLPPEKIKNYIEKIVDNLIFEDVKTKSLEIKKILKTEWFEYFSQYLITQKVSIDVNQQDSYQKLINEINNQELKQVIFNATYTNIEILIKSKNISESSSERTLLRNLGTWLGMLTLKRSRPILRKKLDLEKIIFNSWDKNNLIVTIPFISKILNSCAVNKVFGPPNPWLMNILSILVEIYQIENIKLTLQFEIEKLLCEIGLKIEDIQATKFLKKKKEFSKKQKLEKKQTKETEEIMQYIAQNFKGWSHYVRINRIVNNICPQLTKNKVAELIESSILPIILMVIERSAYVACTTTKEIVLKDLFMEKNSNLLKKTAHHMVLSLTSSLSLVTSKEYFLAAFKKRLKNVIKSWGKTTEMVEKLVEKLAKDNFMLGCNLISKVSMDKAIKQINKTLTEAYLIRNNCSKKGKIFLDSVYKKKKSELDIPRYLISYSKGLTENQFEIYNELSQIRNQLEVNSNWLSQFEPENEFLPPDNPMITGVCRIYNHVIKIAFGIPNLEYASVTDFEQTHYLIKEINYISYILRQCLSCESIKLLKTIVEFIFQRIYDHIKIRFLIEFDLILLGIIRHHKDNITINVVTRCILNKISLNQTSIEVLITLLRENVLSLSLIDITISEIIKFEFSSNNKIIEIVIVLIRRIMSDVQIKYKITSFHKIITELRKVRKGENFLKCKNKRRINYVSWNNCQVINWMKKEGFMGWHFLKIKGINGIFLNSLIKGDKNVEDYVLTDMMQKCFMETLQNLEKGSQKFPKDSISLNIINLLDRIKEYEINKKKKQDSDIWLDGKMIIDTIPEYAYNIKSSIKSVWISVFEDWLENPIVENLVRWLQSKELISEKQIETYFLTIISYILKKYREYNSFTKKSIQYFSKLVKHISKIQINYLNNFLHAYQSVLLNEYISNPEAFHQLIFYTIISEVSYLFFQENNVMKTQLNCILSLFAKCYNEIRPQRVPIFVFGWLELISNKNFIVKFLKLEKNSRIKELNFLQNFRRNIFKRLLVNFLKFICPFFQTRYIDESIELIYRGILRVIIILLYDFPNFLVEFHLDFCNVIPSNCVQLINLILSAFPPNLSLPNPFLPNLKVDLLPEIYSPPKIYSDISKLIHDDIKFETLMKSFIGNTNKDSKHNFFKELSKKLNISKGNFNHLSYQLINSIYNAMIIFMGKAICTNINHIKLKLTDRWRKVFIYIFHDLKPESSYYMLNSIINQLRFPNNHTHMFSCIILILFENTDEFVKELVTRIILQRLVVYRPHPWGLLITFIELMKNPRYKFWQHSFIRIAPEMHKLLENFGKDIC